MTIRPLSELEGAVLGIVFRSQPCTAYAVRQVLKDTPSSRWRASAGSIYPLLARLEEKGVIKTTADSSDGRHRKVLTLTKKGRAALNSWIKAGAMPEVVSEVSDPIRSRVFFLDVLPKKEQIKFVTETILALEQFLKITRDILDAMPPMESAFSTLGSQCAIMNDEARLESMKMILKHLEQSKAG